MNYTPTKEEQKLYDLIGTEYKIESLHDFIHHEMVDTFRGFFKENNKGKNEPIIQSKGYKEIYKQGVSVHYTIHLRVQGGAVAFLTFDIKELEGDKAVLKMNEIDFWV